MKVRNNTRSLLYLIAFGAAAMLIVMLIVAPKAKADPVDDYGPALCARLDAAEAITPDVLRSVGRYLKGQGFSNHDAASILWDSIQIWCPRHSWSVSYVLHLTEQGVIR